MLRLKTKTCAIGVGLPPATQAAVEKVTGIKLYARLLGIHLEHASGGRLRRAGSEGHFFRRNFVQHEIMVITQTASQLLIIAFNIGTDCFRCTKIKCCAGNRTRTTHRNLGFINRRESIRIDHQLMLQNIALPCEIKITVLR